jgi:hypothetical protein
MVTAATANENDNTGASTKAPAGRGPYGPNWKTIHREILCRTRQKLRATVFGYQSKNP